LLAARSSPTVNSQIELRMHDALMAVGIGFTAQSVLLDSYLVDMEIRQAPVVIEADGATHRLRAQKAKDALRDANLNAAGYRVFRFTGGEINRDAAQCVKRVMDACGLTPDADPVYDIRTRFAGTLHPRWKGGPAKFTCANCDKAFEKAWQHRQGERTFCNAQCYGEWLHNHPEANNARLKRDWSQLGSLYAAGMSSKQLATYYGCGQKGILSALRNLGIPVRQQGGRRVKGGFHQAGGLPSS